MSTVLNVLHVEGRYLGYITDKDSVNMTGLYMMSQFILFSISRLAILKFKPEYKSVLNLWFFGNYRTFFCLHFHYLLQD